MNYVLSDADIRILKRLAQRERGQSVNHLPPQQGLQHPGRLPVVRMGKAYGALPAATYNEADELIQAGKGECLLKRLKSTDGTVHETDSLPTVCYNLAPFGIEDGEGLCLLRDQTLEGAAKNKSEPGYVALRVRGLEAEPPRFGFGKIGPAGTDLSSDGIVSVDGMHLLASTAFTKVDSDPAAPVTTMGGEAGAGPYDLIQANVSGIWTGHFSASVRIPTTIAATPPGSYDNKIASVSGPAGSVNLTTGAIDGEEVVTHDLCLHELFVRRTLVVLLNANLADPRAATSIATAEIWNKRECGLTTFHDAHIPFTVELDDLNTLSIWFDDHENVTTDPGVIAWQTNLLMHFNNEAL